MFVEADDVAKRRARQPIRFTATIAREPMPQHEWVAVQDLLARMIARAYAAEHPELFRPVVAPSEVTEDSGPPAAAELRKALEKLL